MIENLIGIFGIIIGAFIAYHVFFLSRKLSNKTRLEHKDKIKQKARELLSKIYREKINSEVYLVNINRYFKDYPSDEEKVASGYSHIKAEIKATRFDGIEFFCSLPEQVYQKPNGSLSFKKEGNEEAFIVYPVGIVPYEWIEYIDLEGDEYVGVPLIYSHYKGNIYWKLNWKRFIPFGYPYKKLNYYKESDVYHEGSDPMDMKWVRVDIKK